MRGFFALLDTVKSSICTRSLIRWIPYSFHLKIETFSIPQGLFRWTFKLLFDLTFDSSLFKKILEIFIEKLGTFI